MPIWDFECKKCGNIFEEVSKISDSDNIRCPKCQGETKKVWLQLNKLAYKKFPEGFWNDLGPKPVYISSRRQLREEVKKRGTDEFTECYSKYDDGYGGF